MNIEHEVKVGIFLLFSIAVLVFSIMWLNNFEMGNNMHIYARFKDVGPLGEGTRVIYRGVDVGRVSDIDLSSDNQYAMVDISVTNKKIKFPKYSTASVIDKGFTGTKVLVINPPEKFCPNELLKSNDVIEGKKSFTFEELQNLLAKKSEGGVIESIIDNTDLLIKNSNKLTAHLDKVFVMMDDFTDKKNRIKLNTLVDNIIVLSQNMNETSKTLNGLLKDKTIAGDFKSTMASAQTAFVSLNSVTNKTSSLFDKSKETMNNIDSVLQNTDKTLNNPKGSLRDSLEKMSDVLTDIKSITGDNKLKEDLKGVIQNTDKTLNNLGCFSTELSSSLSKGFLIQRMLFGNPWKNMGKCKGVTND